MCFFLLENKKYVADRDIIVFKATHKSQIFPGRFISTYQKFTYSKNTKNDEVELLVEEYGGTDCHVVEAGYHSYVNNPKGWSTNMVGLFIIPKGSTYYKNSEEYVSSNIIYKGRYSWFRYQFLRFITSPIVERIDCNRFPLPFKR